MAIRATNLNREKSELVHAGALRDPIPGLDIGPAFPKKTGLSVLTPCSKYMKIKKINCKIPGVNICEIRGRSMKFQPLWIRALWIVQVAISVCWSNMVRGFVITEPSFIFVPVAEVNRIGCWNKS